MEMRYILRKKQIVQLINLHINYWFINRVMVFLLCTLFWNSVVGQNPIIPSQGVNDPHIHIFNDTAFLFATHDKSIDNTRFIMEDWWLWYSTDLVNWELHSILNPQDTYLGGPYESCWATDAAFRDGTFYWYFSEKNQRTGVVTSNSSTGPWKDPLGKPLLDSDLTDTDEYDPAIFEEDGDYFILFGVWDYFLARLNEDMISLAETPRRIAIQNPVGPYGPGKTDDKPYLHKYQGKYYLSWGCFYAMSDSLYGPYDYIGTVIDSSSFAPGYAAPTWPHGFLQGRHGSYFTWNNQWYYTYCDISQTGNRYFRDSFISYIHYKENGEIAPIRVDGVGVGRYESELGAIQAEDYFSQEGWQKVEWADNQFAVVSTSDPGTLIYPNIRGMDQMNNLSFQIQASQHSKLKVSLHAESQLQEPFEQVLEISPTSEWEIFQIKLPRFKDHLWSLQIENIGNSGCLIDHFTFSP